MPSPYTLPQSVADAEALASRLGMITCTVPIGEIYEVYRKTLGYASEAQEVTLAEENLQARIRGNILMAISNREGALVLSTGNKSELSVGYCTLYGDMAGGFALISDIPKGMVYALAEHLNRERKIIPRAIIERPPTAELRPNQTDQDSLPPYPVLDAIMKAYIEDRQSAEAIIAQGMQKATVERVVRLIDRNEYKRRQAAPGIKITSKAFGLGRRFPIAWKP
jgi:NAD+ synthase (glutamine-hydrolysing)